jgi:hypothetical protein
LAISAVAFIKNFQSQLPPDEAFKFVDEMKPFCNLKAALLIAKSDD